MYIDRTFVHLEQSNAIGEVIKSDVTIRWIW